jgi:ketosteroid isomerase-like protein
VSENIETVRGLHEAFQKVGMEAVRTALTQMGDYDPASPMVVNLGLSIKDDVEVELIAASFSLPDMPSGTILRGPEGWLRFWRAWLEPWTDFESSFGNFADNGDEVVLDITISARGRQSGIPIELQISQVWTVRDGSVARVRIYGTRAEALEAAGLTA